MGFGVGSLTRIAYAREASWGAELADATHHRVLPFRSETLVGGQGSVESDEISGNRMYEEPLQGNLNVNGDINVQWSADAHAFLVWAMMGGITNPVLQTVRHNPEFKSGVLHDEANNPRYRQPDGTVTDDEELAQYVGISPAALPDPPVPYSAATDAQKAAALWTHYIEQLKATSTDLPSFAVEKAFLNVGDTGFFLPFRGVTVNRLSFEVAPEAFVIGAVGLIGKEEAAPQEASAIADADLFRVAHRGLNSFEGALNIDNKVAANIVRTTINLDNQVTQENVVGSQLAGARFPGRLRIAGTAEALFDSGALYARYKAYETTNMQLGLKDSAAQDSGKFGPASMIENEGSYFGDREIQIVIPGFKFGGATPQVGGEGPVNIPLEFTAFRDAQDDRQLQFIATNGQADLTANMA